METPYRLKIKIGPHEFEAEGNAEVVQEQFRIFKELIGSTPVVALPQPQIIPPASDSGAQNPPARTDTSLADSSLGKITKLENRIISLTVRPKGTEDAILLLLYAQKILRENEAVTGAEIMSGIVATGGMFVMRVDKLLEKLGKDGDVIVIGERRSKRYRLTNAGVAKARQIATDLLAIVA
jgi:hypothetical protein